MIFSKTTLNRNIYFLDEEEYQLLDIKPKKYKFFTNYNRYLYFLEDEEKKINKLEVIIFSDGSFEENYSWDEEKEREDKLTAAKYFFQWANDTMMNRIFDYEKENKLLILNYDEDGDLIDFKESWDNGVFTFRVINNKVIYNLELMKDSISRNLPMLLPEYFIEGFLEHHKITNEELQEEWKPWNTLVIKSPYNSIPYDDWEEYVTYKLEIDNV